MRTQKFYNLKLNWINTDTKMDTYLTCQILRGLFGISSYQKCKMGKIEVAQYIAKHFNVSEITIVRVGNWQDFLPDDGWWLQTFRITELKPISNYRKKTPQQLANDNDQLIWALCQFIRAIEPLPVAINGEVNVDVQLNIKGWIIRDMVNAINSSK